MALYILLPASLLLFVLFHYLVRPQLEKTKSHNRWVEKLGKPGALAIVKYVYTFFFIATLMYALLIVATFVAGLSGAGSSTEFESVITRIQGLRDWLKVFKSYWALAIFTFIFIGLTVITYRRLKSSIEAEMEEEKERFRVERGDAEWESLVPTAEMNDVAQKIYTAQAMFDRLDPSLTPQNKATQDARAELSQKIKELRAAWHELDAGRRAHNHEARPARTDSSGRRESGARTFFGSKGFLESLQRLSRGVSHAGLALLFLSLVGVHTPLVDSALAQRQVHLSELQVKANQQEARASFARLMAEQSDEGERELKPEDEEALEQLARHFERSFASSHVWHPPYGYRDASAHIRRDLIKEKIIGVHGNPPPDDPNSPPDDGGPDLPKPDDGGGPKGGGPKGGGPQEGGGGVIASGGSSRTDGVTTGRREDGTRDASQTGGKVKSPPPKGDGGGDAKTTPIASPPGGKTTNGPSVADANFSTDDIRNSLSGDGMPLTGIGKRFSDDVRRGVAGKSKKIWGRVKDSVAAYVRKFGEPFEPLEFSKWVIGETVGATVDATWPLTGEVGEIDEPLKGTVKAGLKDAAKKFYESVSGGQDNKEVTQRVYDLTYEQFMTDLAGGVPLEHALERVEAGVAGRPVASISDMMKLRVVSQELLSSEVFKNLENSLKENPPTLPEPLRDAEGTKTAAARFEKTMEGKKRSEIPVEEYRKMVAMMDTYEDHYPGRPDAAQQTAKAAALAKVSKAPASPEVSAELYAQSRDFSRLKRSTDVGGVLVGREPQSVADDVDFRDLTWTVNGNDVTLGLKRGDGSVATLGPYDRDVVNVALLFMADGRKVAVTIQNSFRENGTLWKRVYLHPALADTALGHDVIEFDEFVFKFIDGHPEVDAATQRVASQELLYDLAWSHRRRALCQLVLDRTADASMRTYMFNQMQLDVEYIKRTQDNQKSMAAIRGVLLEAKKLDDRQTSFLLKYPAHFDPELLSTIIDCGERSGGSVDTFGTCVQDETRTKGMKEGVPAEKMKQWLASPVDTHPRSIAEEVSFDVDAGLKFLSPGEAEKTAAQLWPFEFRYEIAFPARPPFLPEGEKQDSFLTPWEYKELRTIIAEKVLEGVQAEARTSALFRRVRDFTTLQRLFRTTLDGGLGGQFPIEKLVGLTRATASRKRETPRWRMKNMAVSE